MQGFFGAAAVSLGLILANPFGGVEFPSAPSIPSVSQVSAGSKVPAVATPVPKAKTLAEQGNDF